jgi:hypothetical protein
MGASVTWHARGVRWVLTRWVSCRAGLPVPPSRLLSLIDTLTSCLDGEEGVGMGVVGSGLSRVCPLL